MVTILLIPEVVTILLIPEVVTIRTRLLLTEAEMIQKPCRLARRATTAVLRHLPRKRATKTVAHGQVCPGTSTTGAPPAQEDHVPLITVATV